MDIAISHYKDPYKPINIMECHKGFERCSDGAWKWAEMSQEGI